jgi:hypothetical protein
VPEPSDEDIDYLLSSGRLSQPHKHELLRGVLASVQASSQPRRRFRWRWPAFAALSVSGALAAVALYPRPAAETGTALREKGVLPRSPIIAMTCLGGSLAACPAGSRIAFWSEGGPKEAGLVTAYGDPVGGGERVWYLTNAELPGAAVIGREQPTGRYEVGVVLTKGPIERSTLAQLPAELVVAHANFSLVVSR